MWKALTTRFGLFGVSVVVASLLALLFVPGLIMAIISPGQYMPHRHCYLDQPNMILLQALSDFAIGVAYMLISVALVYLVYKARNDIPFEWMFLAFGLFIFSCGWTHFMETWTVWYPAYWLSGGIKAVTAVASIATALGLQPLLPRIFALIQTAKASEERKRELERSRIELERAYQELEAFSYSLAHDMRAPLRAIGQFAEVLKEDNAEQLDAQGMQHLEKIGNATHRLNRLIDDVLTYTRITRAPLELRRVDTEKLVRDLVGERPDLQPPGVEIQIATPLAPVLGDDASLTQCINNLLSNAVKFVRPGVTPKIQIRTEPRDGWVRIWFEDNGIGIEPQSQQRIFGLFQRLHHEREYAGTGLGLSIVRKAVERMGGTVGVESQLGQGSRFWIQLKDSA